MRIAGLSKLTTIDFPGRLACILFTAGCNYDCGFCHNRSLLYTDTLLDEDEVWSFLRKRAGQLEGVVISGGEPTLQWDLEDAARRIRSLGYAVKLDTNGSNPESGEAPACVLASTEPPAHPANAAGASTHASTAHATTFRFMAIPPASRCLRRTS